LWFFRILMNKMVRLGYARGDIVARYAKLITIVQNSPYHNMSMRMGGIKVVNRHLIRKRLGNLCPDKHPRHQTPRPRQIAAMELC